MGDVFMYEIEINRMISGAHQLRDYPGDCVKLHGHNWQITAILEIKELDELGISIDFKRLKKELDAIILPLDHAFLNDLPDYRHQNPTSENIARTLYRELSRRLNDGNVRVARIKVSESPSSCASYYE